MTESGIAKVTKRFIVAVGASGLVYWSLKVHREWVWAYFDSIMTYPNAGPDLANVATASISALTTAFIASSTTIAFIVAFFITGNVAALRGMFQWGSVAQTVGETLATSTNERLTQKSEVDEKLVQHFAGVHRDDPSYIKPEQLPDQ